MQLGWEKARLKAGMEVALSHRILIYLNIFEIVSRTIAGIKEG